MEPTAPTDDVARFFARTIAGDARYISHGEIQCGLSLDGERWADDLDVRFVEDLAEADPDRSILIARTSGGEIAAAAIVQWTVTPRVRFGTLEDLSVDPALRSGGIGAAMAAEVEAEARRRDMRWLFLESGKDNAGAHHFFEAHGFHPLSQVFVKPLGG